MHEHSAAPPDLLRHGSKHHGTHSVQSKILFGQRMQGAHRRLSTRRCSSCATAAAPAEPMRVKARSSVRSERSEPSTLQTKSGCQARVSGACTGADARFGMQS